MAATIHPQAMQGKVALVTGAGSGIGRATALAFAAAGARVVAADVDVAGGEETVRLAAAAGGEAAFVRTDVTVAGEVAALVRGTVDRFGRLDYAHNNAGIVAGALVPMAEYPDADWHRIIGVNLTGVWLCMKAELAPMLAQGAGAIVNTASALGLVGGEPAAYVASKHGVVGLTKAAALQYATRGIRVNAVCPGFTDTPMLGPDLDRSPELRAFMEAREPMGRLGRPEEVAQAVVWLCSEAASFVTGHALAVDGGYVAW